MTPHDQLFRGTFSDPAAAAGLLRALLPPAVLPALDFAELRLAPSSFVEPELQDRVTDLLFVVPLREGGEVWVHLLVEHQRAPDGWMPWRLLDYSVAHWRRVRAEAKGRRLPAIVPIVVYNGVRPWTAPTRFSALLDLPSPSRAALARHLIDFEFILEDLNVLTDAELHQRTMTAAARLTLVALKHADGDLRATLHRNGRLLRDLLLAPTGQDALVRLFRYCYRVSDAFTPEVAVTVLETELGPEEREIAMTVAERLHEQGVREGQRALMLRLLEQALRAHEAYDEAWADRMRAADSEQLEAWLTQLLAAASPEGLGG